MTDEEIRLRLAGGEDSRTQFKREPIGVAKLAAELTAFTNAEGGVIFFGVNDDGSVAGLDAAQKKTLNDELSNASNDNVRPAVYPRTEFHVIDGRQILAVIVSEGVSKPYADKSGSFWTKSGPDKRRITAREELQRLLQTSLLIHADELPVAKTSVEDIDLYHFGEFLENNYGILKTDVLTPGKVDLPQKLQNLGLMDGTQLTRNPLIFSFATKEMPYRALGTGVQRALELGAKVDLISDREVNLFKVVLYPCPPVNPSVLRSEGVNACCEGVKSHDEGVTDVEKGVNTQDEGVLLLEKVIVDNPGKRANELGVIIGRSVKTIERYLKTLKASHRIEFRGAPKNGGYYVKGESQRDESEG